MEQNKVKHFPCTGCRHKHFYQGNKEDSISISKEDKFKCHKTNEYNLKTKEINCKGCRHQIFRRYFKHQIKEIDTSLKEDFESNVTKKKIMCHKKEHKSTFMTREDTFKAYVKQQEINKRKAFQNWLKRREEIHKRGSPAWYQELSCRQIVFIDSLGESIKADIEEGILARTIQIISGLGILPRPTIQQIKKAAYSSNANPVLFLLHLYRLIKTTENMVTSTGVTKQYFSVNDRLVLSALTHLMIWQTLYELDMFLPTFSEHNDQVTASQEPKGKQRKKLYSSPYLEPQPVLASKIWSKLDKYKRLKKLENTSQFTLKGPCQQSFSESRETVLKIVPLDMLASVPKTTLSVPINTPPKIMETKLSENIPLDTLLESKNEILELKESSIAETNELNISTSKENLYNKLRSLSNKSNIMITKNNLLVEQIDPSREKYNSFETKLQIINERGLQREDQETYSLDTLREISLKDDTRLCYILSSPSFLSNVEEKESVFDSQIISSVEHILERDIVRSRSLNEDQSSITQQTHEDPNSITQQTHKDQSSITKQTMEEKLHSECLDDEQINEGLLEKSTKQKRETQDDLTIPLKRDNNIIVETSLAERVNFKEYWSLFYGKYEEKSRRLSNVTRNKHITENLIKDILEFMAVNGNPLAALPNVHKLPQIKMWIKYKNGFQLDQNIKAILLKKSCAESNYQIANPRYVAPPKFHLPFNHRQLDWDDFHWLRKKGDQVKQTYRSKVRRAHVDDARDYWSTMCMEYFPHHNFRSVFFAYLPAREEDILAIPGTDFGQF